MTSRFDIRKAGAIIEKQDAEITRLRKDREAVERFMAHLQTDVESGHIELEGSTDEAYRELIALLTKPPAQ